MHLGQTECMDRTLAAVVANPTDERFQALTQAPERHGTASELQDGFLVALCPGARGAVELDALQPFMDAPCYRLRPVGCEARSWYRIEYELSPTLFHELSAIIPMLEASSPDGVTVFALLRIKQFSGRSSDVGSAQINVGRSRQLHSFPISLHDLPVADRTDVQKATLCLFIEARPAALHLHRLAVHGIDAIDDRLSPSDLKMLRDMATQHSPRVRRRGISTQDCGLWTGRAKTHQRIADDVYVDVEPAEGRSVAVSRSPERLDLVFENTSDAQWRNIEFRFREVPHSDALAMFVRAVSPGETQVKLRPRVVIRQYDQAGGWGDTTLPEPPVLFDTARDGQTKIDLSCWLDESRALHSFGLMLFFPDDVEKLSFSDLEVFVIDRAIDAPPAAPRLDLSKLLRTAKRVAQGRG